MFMEHDPHIPSLHDLLKVKVGSTVSLIFIRASSTIGPQLKKMMNIVIRILRKMHSTYQCLVISFFFFISDNICSVTCFVMLS